MCFDLKLSLIDVFHVCNIFVVIVQMGLLTDDVFMLFLYTLGGSVVCFLSAGLLQVKVSCFVPVDLTRRDFGLVSDVTGSGSQ